MALIVFALSCMPCADTEIARYDKEKSEISTSSTQQDHEEGDVCSPFCHCACCAGFSLNHSLAAVSIVPVYPQSHKTYFLPAEVIEIVLPIWQPPRLV